MPDSIAPTDPTAPEPDDAAFDVEGHSVPRMMGMGQLTRPGSQTGTGARAAGEPAEADLPPLTRRFPRMRDSQSRTPQR